MPTRVIPANHDMFLDSNTFKIQREKEFKLYFGGSRSSDGFLIQGDLGLSKSFDYEEGYFNSLRYVERNMKNTPSTEVERYVRDIALGGKCKTLESLKASNENPSK